MVFMTRKGKRFKDTGTALIYDPQQQTFNGTYLVKKAEKPVRVKKDTRQQLEYLKGETL